MENDNDKILISKEFLLSLVNNLHLNYLELQKLCNSCEMIFGITTFSNRLFKQWKHLESMKESLEKEIHKDDIPI